MNKIHTVKTNITQLKKKSQRKTRNYQFVPKLTPTHFCLKPNKQIIMGHILVVLQESRPKINKFQIN